MSEQQGAAMKPEPSVTALARAHELCEWERIMWAVLWDTQPNNRPRQRHLCMLGTKDEWFHHPALFPTRREAQAYINRHFDWVRWDQHRKPPHNHRLPKPYRVRVRITIPEARDE